GVNFFRLVKNAPSLFGYFSESAGRTAEKFSHPLLKRFYRALLSDDFSSLAVVIVFATFCGKNGGLPRGGSVAAAERIAQRFIKLGGELHLGNGAEKIVASGKSARSVVLSDGTELAADYVVIATDPTAAMGKLLDFSLPKQMLRQYRNPLYRRFSAVHCAFSASEAPFSGDLIIPAPPYMRTAFGARDIVIREFSHEPDFAPAGKVALQAFFFCEEDECQRLVSLREAPAAYKAEKARVAMHVQAAIEQRFPSLHGDLDLLDVWTPATYRRYTGAEAGAFMSFLVPPFSLPSRTSGRIKEYENVFLATQWLQPPGGLPIAAAAGKSAAALVDASIRREKRIAFSARKRALKRG
ncbi:MAG: FAD-dependent oxidoreductase, partial [Clostridia bacterium]|nr:FAD-dependent oxidoreductase [Clostridia bacterium]